MSEIENNVNETENENVAVEAAGESVEAAEPAEVEVVDAVEDELEDEQPSVNYDEELMDKAQKAARLLRSRRFAMGKEDEARAERMGDLKRALKLLELKPEMEQKEISDLLGMRLRELDALMIEAESVDLVARIVPEDEDMRKVVIRAAEETEEGLAKLGNKKEKLLPSLSADEMLELIAALDKIVEPLVAMGLDRDDDRRGGFGGRDDRGGRGGFGGRGGRDDRRGGDRGGRGGFGGRDDRRGGRDDRGGRGGFGGNRGGRDDRRGGYGDRGGNRGGYGDRGGNRGNFGGNRGGRDDRRGGRNGGGFKGNRGGFRD